MAKTTFDWRIKGLPEAAEGLDAAGIARLGLNLLAGDLMLPAAVLRIEAVRHNVQAMQAFADRHGAHLCPHGKTSMSPELFAMQLDGGAWGLTAATAHHVRIYRRIGVRRILLANQLVGRADIEFILSELADDAEFEFYCLADSEAGVDLLARAVEESPLRRPLQVLLEIGVGGARTGVRGIERALALAGRIAACAPHLALCGVEVYEGVRQRAAGGPAEAASMLDGAGEAAARIAAEGLFAPGPVLLSAGGSAFLDLCAAHLPDRIDGHRVERVLRPGCYVTHDHGLYQELTAGSEQRGLPPLEPALEVWGAVLSLPEAGRAVVGAGKRDMSYDSDLPIPLWIHRAGRDGGPVTGSAMRTLQLWDQHALLETGDADVSVGDLVGFGISHPCATFDRWRAILTVDEDYGVTGAVTTLF